MDEDFLQLSKIFIATKFVVRVPDLDPKFKITVLASKQQSGIVFKRQTNPEVASVIVLEMVKLGSRSAVGAISSAGLLDEISCELLGFIASVVHIKTSYGYELMAKSHSLLRLDIRDHDRRSLVGTGSTEVVDAMTGVFLRSKDRLNIYGCTMDDKVWEHPKEWRPERFLDENKDSVDLYKMTTFENGKRAFWDILLLQKKLRRLNIFYYTFMFALPHCNRNLGSPLLILSVGKTCLVRRTCWDQK
ncbi:hypothetical protein RJ640_006227 [Escallonia rubra]|uniref:Uncharacterized protein n=1 Tax=Escallonia rubra TaxID=112253 RepID=A0AA88REF9_9ASTE|nr:hypothetical protein RJ640_006227 [Escallonia rubra]